MGGERVRVSKWVSRWVCVCVCVRVCACILLLPKLSLLSPGSTPKEIPEPNQSSFHFCSQSYLHDPYFFLYATLATTDGQDLHFMNGTRTTAGSVVQSLHKLKDIDDKGMCVIPPKTKEHALLIIVYQDGGFFIFADISVRHEGFFKLKFTLFKIIEQVSHVLFSLHSRLTRKIFFSRLYNRTHVYRLCSAFSDAFQVYSPKSKNG